jgi:hypothetical protein
MNNKIFIFKEINIINIYLFMNKKPKARIVRIEDKIIITNYKCMFSSLNQLNICELNPSNSIKYEKIMLYRNPYTRTISCFLNWMVRYPKIKKVFNISKEEILSKKNFQDQNELCGWLIPLLLKEPNFDYNNYKVLLEKNNILELFKIYINFLPKIKNKNSHMFSQITIVKENQFNINTFINIDKKNDILIFKEKIKQDLPLSNQSANENKLLCEDFLNKNINYKNKIYEIYKDDFKFLPIE